MSYLAGGGRTYRKRSGSGDQEGETRKGRQPTQGVLRARDFEGPLGLSATGDLQEMYRECLRVIPPKG